MMKRCPQCNRTYADETLSYCLDDGALLSAPYDPEATQFLPGSSDLLRTTAPSPPSPVNPPATHRNRNLTYVVILVLAVLLTGSAVALFYEKGKENVNPTTRQAEIPAPASNQIKAEPPDNLPSNMNTRDSPAAPTIEPDRNQARFAVSACNSIRDSQTGLEWYIGPNRNMTWDEAQQWTSGLNGCGGGWRMPTIEEIRTLYNPSLKAGTGFYLDGKYFPAHIDPIFGAIGGGSWVWSGEKMGAGNARSFNLNQGKPVVYSTMNTYYSTRAFAVRNKRS